MIYLHRTIKKIFRWVCLSLQIVACNSPEPPPANHLRISFNTQPTTLDPQKAGDFISSTMISMIYEGLTRCLPGGTPEPALAESVELSEDQKTYIFHLRKANWSDGTPITAYDFERSWKRILSSPSLCTYLFYPIKNVEKCVKGEAFLSEVGIRALDEQTFCVELERPTSYFYSLTAFPSFLPVPSHLDSTEMIWSGPFCIKKGDSSSEIILVKNQNFWNHQEIAIDEIHISIVSDEMAALQMFERGELDWIGGHLSPLPFDALEEVKDQISFIPSAATTLCTFNTQTFPFYNVHLRKAFSYAIDRYQIVDHLTQASQIPATSLLPPCLSSQNQELTDPIQARHHFEQGLKELGIVSSDLQNIVLYYKPGSMEKRLAQTLQKQWKEVLGVTIQLIQLDFKSHAHRLKNRDYQISLASWIAQFDDPMSILERFKDKAHLKNYPGWEDPIYIQLLNEANTSDERDVLLEKAETYLTEAAPLTPIYHWNSPVLFSSRITMTGTTPCGGILFERFHLAH